MLAVTLAKATLAVARGRATRAVMETGIRVVVIQAAATPGAVILGAATPVVVIRVAMATEILAATEMAILEGTAMGVGMGTARIIHAKLEHGPSSIR